MITNFLSKLYKNLFLIIDNSRKIESIRSAVEDSGNRDEDVAVMKLSESVREKSSELVSFMEDQGHKIVKVDYQPTSEMMILDFAERIKLSFIE